MDSSCSSTWTTSSCMPGVNETSTHWYTSAEYTARTSGCHLYYINVAKDRQGEGGDRGHWYQDKKFLTMHSGFHPKSNTLRLYTKRRGEGSMWKHKCPLDFWQRFSFQLPVSISRRQCLNVAVNVPKSLLWKGVLKSYNLFCWLVCFFWLSQQSGEYFLIDLVLISTQKQSRRFTCILDVM